MHIAIATSLLVIAFNSFVGLATRFATASIEWAVVSAFLAGGLGGNIVALKLVHRLDQRNLKRIFAVFIFFGRTIHGSERNRRDTDPLQVIIDTRLRRLQTFP
jgi:uncharacterized membrane protein YfcA